MSKELIRPDYLFEISWEVCNKVGGIYTVIATRESIRSLRPSPSTLKAN